MSLSLKQLQESFQAYVLQQYTSVLAEINDTVHAPATLRLDIYREGYYLRLIDIIAMDYPIVKQLLGKKFEKLARDYIINNPSHRFSIRTFASKLAEFLAMQKCKPVIAEMASFEWSLAQVLDAPDAPYLTFEEITKIPPDDWAIMQLEFHPSVDLKQFHYNVDLMWQAFNEQQALPSAKKQKTLTDIVFWRFQQEAYFMPLTAHQLFMFNAIKNNQTFGEICEQLCDYLPEEAVIQFAAGAMRHWVDQGLFTRLHIEKLS